MNDNEKQIINKLSDGFNKLSEKNQAYIVGVVEGMSLVDKKPDEKDKEKAVV